MRRKSTTEQFIKKAIVIHCDKYDYSDVNYVHSRTTVKIYCNHHKEFFEQTPAVHLAHHGCPKCGIETHTKNRTFTTEQFIEKAIAVHGDTYGYSNVNYVSNCINVKIYCYKHKGFFEQQPLNHLSGRGCRECGSKYRKNRRKSVTECPKSTATKRFIEKSISVHGDRYDYSFTKYVIGQKVKILCPIHGIVNMVPNVHLNGCGCKYCDL